MNLEQLLEKQEGLNNLLQLHLKDLEVTVDKIAGVIPEDAEKLEPEKQPNGILEELFSAQERLEQKIDRLNLLKQRLNNSVYSNNITCGSVTVQIPRTYTSQQH